MVSSPSLDPSSHVVPSSSAAPAASRDRGLVPRGALSGLVAIAGGAIALAGGGWKAGAFNMYPREDGLFTAGLVAALATFGHGLPERTALLASAPILALSFYGILRFHHAPLALVGAELVFLGVIGVAFEQWRARVGPRGA